MYIDSSWARQLISASEQLSIPAHLPAIMHGHDQLRGSIAEMFTRFTIDTLPRVRAWVDGGQRYTITDALIALAKKPNLSLPQRLAEATGSPHYCVTFNGLSAWNEEFAQTMQACMLDPLFAELNGPPGCGADFYTFIGNYGYTPFGVHDDRDHSLLWHVGPAPKVAYVWPRSRYIELTGGVLATVEYKGLLAHAQRYELHPGDLLFIPAGDFHILETCDFSCTMGLTLFPDDMLLECTEGLRLLAPDELTLKSREQAPLTLEQLILLRRAAVRSNGGVITPPNLDMTGRDAPDTPTLRQSTLRIVPSWALSTTEIAGRQALHVRGRVIWGRSNRLFGSLCELLAGGEAVPFVLIEEQLSGQAHVEAIAEVVRRAVDLGGILVERR